MLDGRSRRHLVWEPKWFQHDDFDDTRRFVRKLASKAGVFRRLRANASAFATRKYRSFDDAREVAYGL